MNSNDISAGKEKDETEVPKMTSSAAATLADPKPVVVEASVDSGKKKRKATSEQLPAATGEKKKKKVSEPTTNLFNYGDGVTEETTSDKTTSNTIVRHNGEVVATIDKAKGNNIKIEVRMGCARMRQQIALSIGATLGPRGLTITPLGGGNYSGSMLPPHHEATISRWGMTTNGFPYMSNGCFIMNDSSVIMGGGRW